MVETPQEGRSRKEVLKQNPGTEEILKLQDNPQMDIESMIVTGTG